MEESLRTNKGIQFEVSGARLRKLKLEHVIKGVVECVVGTIFVKDKYIPTYRLTTTTQHRLHEIGAEVNKDVDIDQSIITDTLINIQFISMVYEYLFSEYEAGRESVQFLSTNIYSRTLRLEEVLTNDSLYKWVHDYKLYVRVGESTLNINIVDTTTNTRYVEFKLPRKPLEKLMGDLDKLPIRSDGTLGTNKGN